MMGVDGMEPPGALVVGDVPAAVAYGGVVGAQEEMDVLAGAGEAGAVIAADGAGSDDGDFHAKGKESLSDCGKR
jgi:hypothetical protein